MSLKIAHLSDLHFCQETYKWVSQAMRKAIDQVITEADLIVLSGDTFHHPLRTQEDSVEAVAEILGHASTMVPVLVLAGTFSHDAPGSLRYLRHVSKNQPIHIAENVERVYLTYRGSTASFSDRIKQDDDEIVAAICCIPSINRATPEIQDLGAGPWVRARMDEWAPTNRRDRQNGIPSIVVAHGTVTGCVTESRHAMVSNDHEFSLETLAAADTEAVLLGHIHKHQAWTWEGPSGLATEIVYAGSLIRLVFGQHDEVGFVSWDVEPGKAQWEFCPVESRHLLEIDFQGEPDVDDLQRFAETVGEDDLVRVRYLVDEASARNVDKTEIREILSGAASIKIEAQVRPIVSVRSPGIGHDAPTLAAKFQIWAETVEETPRLRPALDFLDLEGEIDDAGDLTDGFKRVALVV